MNAGLVCWSLTSLCHSNGHMEAMPAREINPLTALTRIRSQFLRTQWSTSNHQRVDMTTPQTAQPSGLVQWMQVSISHLQRVQSVYPTLWSWLVYYESMSMQCTCFEYLDVKVLFVCKSINHLIMLIATIATRNYTNSHKMDIVWQQLAEVGFGVHTMFYCWFW